MSSHIFTHHISLLCPLSFWNNSSSLCDSYNNCKYLIMSFIHLQHTPQMSNSLRFSTCKEFLSIPPNLKKKKTLSTKEIISTEDLRMDRNQCNAGYLELGNKYTIRIILSRPNCQIFSAVTFFHALSHLSQDAQFLGKRNLIGIQAFFNEFIFF